MIDQAFARLTNEPRHFRSAPTEISGASGLIPASVRWSAARISARSSLAAARSSWAV